MPKLKDNILFLEEVSEVPYRIDRMLNQLRLAGIFKKLKGVMLGAFVDCNEHDPQKRTLTLGEVIDEYFGKLKIPVIYNFPNGHIKDIFTLPYGLTTKINANDCTAEIPEAAVS
jgi:muramoyltetrapeptide carboxypeptidase